ncbi:MAG TPA: T6SS effector amidase Tae4 family protein [Candidatus Acidoferrum sp.]|nr:T6SS effector amidase Tae4 family protein [Candidatus Acidoferrum sp.]
MIYIPVDFEVLRRNYARRVPNQDDPSKSHLELIDLKNYIDSLPPGNTPCCIQVSHALNLAGQTIPPTNPTARRQNNETIRVEGVSRKYILAVDELEAWLTFKYGAGLDVRKFAGLPDSSNDMEAMKIQLSSVKGILVFREPPGFGMHTELWDGRRILQGDMDEKHLFSRPRILVWCCDPEMQST